MAKRNPAAAYMPSLEQALKAGLVTADTPMTDQKMCALVVMVRVLERRQWRESKVVRWRWARQMKRAVAPPGPKSGFTTALEEVLDVKPCKKCQRTYRNDGESKPCSACGVLCRVVNTADNFTTMSETYLPSSVTADPTMHGFESMLERLTTPAGKLPPKALACPDLRPQRSGGAYRSVPTKKRPQFQGHDFVDTIDRAKTQIERFFRGKEVSKFDVHAWAWPFIRLTRSDWPGPGAALFVDRKKQLRLFHGS